jgi:hypothetical protein
MSDWRPHAGSELAICFGPGGKSHLRGVAGLKRVTKTAFAAHIKTAAGQAAAGVTPSNHWSELIDLLNGPQSWLPVPGGRTDIQVALDRLLILPGFGCFVAGWALSALQEVRGFALKIGKTELRMDESSLYFRPRPDLNNLASHSTALINRAGFCCFFSGDAGTELAGEVLLKLLLERSTTVVQVRPEQLLRLGRSAPFDALLQLYPAIETESFFPALVKFSRDDLQGAPAGLTIFKITRSRSAMIFALSEDRHDCLLALRRSDTTPARIYRTIAQSPLSPAPASRMGKLSRCCKACPPTAWTSRKTRRRRCARCRNCSCC